MFRAHVIIVRRSKLYDTASGIITLKQVSGFFPTILVILIILEKKNTHLFQCDGTKGCIVQF